MQTLPGLEKCWSVYQRVIGAFVYWNTRRKVPNLESGQAMKTSLQSPRVTGISHKSKDIPIRVEGHEICQEARGTPVVVQDDLRTGSR